MRVNQYQMLIDGDWVDAADGTFLGGVNPATCQVWSRFPEATTDDFERAVSPIAEFGGLRTSGYGRESGLQAVYDYTRPKTVWMNTSSEPLASQFIAR